MSKRKARERRRRATGNTDVGSGPNVRRRVLAGVAALLAAAVVAVGVLVARETGPAPAVSTPAGPVVSFSGKDPITGRKVSVADFAGMPVVVNVWASWCTGCIDEAVDLRTFVARHPEVRMIGVDLQDSVGAARAFYRRWGWTHPTVFDPKGEIAFSLGLQGTPSTFFLDRDHRMVARIVGATDLAGFEQGLAGARG